MKCFLIVFLQDGFNNRSPCILSNYLTLNIIWSPSYSTLTFLLFKQYRSTNSYILIQKFFSYLFSYCQNFLHSLFFDSSRDLFFERSCRDCLTSLMRTKRKGMEFGNLIVSDCVNHLLKCFRCLSRKSYNKICPNTDIVIVRSLKSSKSCEDTMKCRTIIVSIHFFENSVVEVLY